MVILSAFVLAVASEAATTFLQQNKDMFSQVPMDTWQSPTKEHPINSFSGRKARA